MSPHEVIDLLELNAELLAELKELVALFQGFQGMQFQRAKAVIAKAEASIAKAERRDA